MVYHETTVSIGRLFGMCMVRFELVGDSAGKRRRPFIPASDITAAEGWGNRLNSGW